MKLKSRPEDFIVREVSARQPGEGRYSLYELTKRSLGTLEALRTVRSHWNLAPSQVSHAGLKDRHAETTQRITIKHGPRADHTTDLLQLTYLGATPTAIGAADIIGNQFEIVVRDLSPSQVNEVRRRVPLARDHGVANYFDAQRFGSLGPSEKYVAAAWCQRDFEQATWLALAEFNTHDRTPEKRDKAFLRDHWGQWQLCKDSLSRSNRRSVITYLVDHPDNFRKAFALIDPDMRGLYLSAFQSGVWNRMLAESLRQTSSGGAPLFEQKIADVVLPFVWPHTDLQRMSLPLPSARMKSPTRQQQQLCNDALQPYDMTLDQMKLSFPRDKWFSRGERAAVLFASDLHVDDVADELNAGRSAVRLSFQLPRGSYATMLIRQLTEPSSASSAPSEEPSALPDLQGGS
ncbi:MAG: tRNA pseudouridine(13) synthase TruD [Planctomycetaceae bacterium]|nr:tRNA pseudouridine(13) synthase TruD [Planctomycetaceae bacterium]